MLILEAPSIRRAALSGYSVHIGGFPSAAEAQHWGGVGSRR